MFDEWCLLDQFVGLDDELLKEFGVETTDEINQSDPGQCECHFLQATPSGDKKAEPGT